MCACPSILPFVTAVAGRPRALLCAVPPAWLQESLGFLQQVVPPRLMQRMLSATLSYGGAAAAPAPAAAAPAGLAAVQVGEAAAREAAAAGVERAAAGLAGAAAAAAALAAAAHPAEGLAEPPATPSPRPPASHPFASLDTGPEAAPGDAPIITPRQPSVAAAGVSGAGIPGCKGCEADLAAGLEPASGTPPAAALQEDGAEAAPDFAPPAKHQCTAVPADGPASCSQGQGSAGGSSEGGAAALSEEGQLQQQWPPAQQELVVGRAANGRPILDVKTLRQKVGGHYLRASRRSWLPAATCCNLLQPALNALAWPAPRLFVASSVVRPTLPYALPWLRAHTHTHMSLWRFADLQLGRCALHPTLLTVTPSGLLMPPYIHIPLLPIPRSGIWNLRTHCWRTASKPGSTRCRPRQVRRVACQQASQSGNNPATQIRSLCMSLHPSLLLCMQPAACSPSVPFSPGPA